MLKMNNFNFICAFSILCSVISLSHLSSSASAGLGNAVCYVSGSLGNCSSGNTPPDLFPKECTAIIYQSLDVSDSVVTDLGEQFLPAGYLDSLEAANKDVIVTYNQKGWPAALKAALANQFQKEVESWKTYLGKHTVIKGLAISNVEPTSSDTEDPDYTQNLKSYIETMRSNFPSLKIGVQVNSVSIVNIVGTPQIKWLDYSCLQPSLDFFLLTSSSNTELYECTPKYQFGEEVPNETTESVRTFLEGYKIPKEKIVYSFDGTPMNSKLTTCDLLYSSMCAKPSVTYCGGKLKHYFDAGAYSANNGGGFGVYFIDTDDVYGCCQCNKTFPIFNALLDGFNGNSAPVCALIDDHK